MKSQWTRVMAACLSVVFLWVVIIIISVVLWCSWWQPPQLHYRGGDMRFRYLDKDAKVFGGFVTSSIKHLEEQGLVPCPPPEGHIISAPTEKGEVTAECYWFKSPHFAGYFRLECWGDPLYGCGLRLMVPVTRQPMDASNTFVAPIAPINPPALDEWATWASDHGARSTDDSIQR